jgi:hypothetical protein
MVFLPQDPLETPPEEDAVESIPSTSFSWSPEVVNLNPIGDDIVPSQLTISSDVANNLCVSQ